MTNFLLLVGVLFVSQTAFSSELDINDPDFVRTTIIGYLNLKPENTQSNARLAVVNEITEVESESIRLTDREVHYLQLHKLFGGEHTDLNSYRLTFRGKLDSGHTFNATCEVIVKAWTDKYRIFLGNNEGQCDLRIDRSYYSKFGSVSVYNPFTYASGYKVFSEFALPAIEIPRD